MSLILDGIDLDALNYTIKVPYNGTIMTGGDSLHANLNIFYDVSLPPSRRVWIPRRAALTELPRLVILHG